jgi:hypothetical protein
MIKKLRHKLTYAPMESIDFFLEQNPDFIDLGKLFITNIFIQSEDENNIYKNREVYKPEKTIKGEEDWYSYLINKCMLAPFESLAQNKVSFLTFNYDRSLEFFLYNFFKEGFSKTKEDVIALLKNFEIIHLYGHLGPLPWHADNAFDYNVKSEHYPERMRYEHSLKSLYLIGEERTENFSKAQNIIAKSERICFLGFGYNRENLDRLNTGTMAGKEVLGSAYGLKKEERAAIERYFKVKDVSLILGSEDESNYDFLREHFRRDL